MEKYKLMKWGFEDLEKKYRMHGLAAGVSRDWSGHDVELGGMSR